MMHVTPESRNPRSLRPGFRDRSRGTPSRRSVPVQAPNDRSNFRSGPACVRAAGLEHRLGGTCPPNVWWHLLLPENEIVGVLRDAAASHQNAVGTELQTKRTGPSQT